MGGCNSTSRNSHKITLGKNKSFSILKDTIKKGKMTYTISFYFDEQIPNSMISDVNNLDEKGTYSIKLLKKSSQSSIKNSLSSIGKSIQCAFNRANEEGYSLIFIDEPRDLVSKDINFILQQMIRKLLLFDLKRSFPKIKSIYLDWEGVDIKQMIAKVEKDLSMI